MMARVAIVALILAVGAIVILGLSDALAPSGIGNLIGGPGVLLLCIPISLALFSFLAHQQSERHRFKEQEKQEPPDEILRCTQDDGGRPPGSPLRDDR